MLANKTPRDYLFGSNQPKRKTALKVQSFGAVFTNEPPLEESRSKITCFRIALS